MLAKQIKMNEEQEQLPVSKFSDKFFIKVYGTSNGENTLIND
jgi:hypothetical protein